MSSTICWNSHAYQLHLIVSRPILYSNEAEFNSKKNFFVKKNYSLWPSTQAQTTYVDSMYHNELEKNDTTVCVISFIFGYFTSEGNFMVTLPQTFMINLMISIFL